MLSQMSYVERSCNLALFYVQGARMSYRPDSMQSFAKLTFDLLSEKCLQRVLLRGYTENQF